MRSLTVSASRKREKWPQAPDGDTEKSSRRASRRFVLKDSHIHDPAVPGEIFRGEKTMRHKIIIAHMLIIALAASAFSQQTKIVRERAGRFEL
jgi:hypothetical protein